MKNERTLRRAAAGLSLELISSPARSVGSRRRGRLPEREFSLFSEMGNTASGATETSNPTDKNEQAPPPDTKPKKKICCACPDTKKLRDECVVQHGEDACGKWIEAHRQCLRAEGFNV
ncbi:hypothetical protein GUJ93_ZPchr0002g26233 [Zizania palustris]|uniref:Cytochrome c oxidase copper chaperone n=1 Tax=Zizania palustris TaxID=103762 RepID=A0A8J5S1Q3_ZIZPA|nr:hypothetical protein GUJ93_ZPchr0002g26233 [Zizania palustris]